MRSSKNSTPFNKLNSGILKLLVGFIFIGSILAFIILRLIPYAAHDTKQQAIENAKELFYRSGTIESKLTDNRFKVVFSDDTSTLIKAELDIYNKIDIGFQLFFIYVAPGTKRLVAKVIYSQNEFNEFAETAMENGTKMIKY